ncbi:MAG: alpha-galactosidase [Caldilinea sp.]|nr:alpha-galactosidase [Caldilinea sp.]MDW8440898.1 alpha-galactosidase [Caldilineaceae bacterium]
MTTIHLGKTYWILETQQTAYAFGLTSRGTLTHAYWGKRLPNLEDYPSPPEAAPYESWSGPEHLTPEEYPAYAGAKYTEPCLKTTFSDGVRDTVLRFVGAEQRIGEPSPLCITLRDAYYPLQVALYYRVHERYDLIERWAEITNLGDAPVLLERAWSALWHLPWGDNYRLSHLSGQWFKEWRLCREFLRPGVKVKESRRLTTGHTANPWFAVDRGAADECQGEVWFGVLAWSGNWKMVAEVTEYGATRIGLGVNDWDFAWRLAPGESFLTPSSLAGYTQEGFGAASRLLHDYARKHLPHGNRLHPVLYNSWEAVFFDVNEASQIALAERAARMGVELFVMDDGWFHRRNKDNAGLGDWWPDERKFPNGLKPLIERINALGMDFGLWIEPEMVNPDSDLYRAHPDWVIHFPTRQRTQMRSQLILNLARSDVQDYLIEKLDALLSEHNIAFIKWDMNRNVSEPGWPDAPGDPRELWVRYVHGVYRVWETLAKRHPHVLWQGCSGGGGRVDFGMLRLVDQFWVSDNTEATARLEIQEGFSQLMPAITMESQVTEMGKPLMPLPFRFHVSMMGVLGVSVDLMKWSEEELRLGAEMIALYKEIRPIVQLGDQYRLLPAQGSPFAAVQYVSKDKTESVLFVFRTHAPEPTYVPPISLRGLDPHMRYRIEGFSETRSGEAWMNLGLRFDLKNGESTVRRITSIASSNSSAHGAKSN